MRNAFLNSLAILTLISLVACGGKKTETDLDKLKQQLAEKRAQAAALQTEIVDLEAQVFKLDSSAQETATRIVTVLPAARKDFEHYTEVQGAVATALDPSPASSETGGRVLQVFVREGQTVTAGQLIAKVDLEAVQKTLDQIQVTLNLARDVYQKQENLWKQQIGSEIQYLQAKNNVEALEKQMESVRFQLNKAEVHAPIAGTIEKVNTKAGELAAPGMPIVTIINYNQLTVKADVSESFLKNLHAGDVVDVDFPALGLKQSARVSEIGRFVNPSNRTFEVKVAVNAAGVLKPNVLANIKFRDAASKDVVLIPTQMISQDPTGQNYVYQRVKGADGDIAKKVIITTGESNGIETVVTTGLKGGEELIDKGARETSDGERIKVIN